MIQTVVKGEHGRSLGRYLWMNFYAPLDERHPQNDIDYDYKSMPSDYELIVSGEDVAFMRK